LPLISFLTATVLRPKRINLLFFKLGLATRDFTRGVLLPGAINQPPRNHRRDHSEQAARDCWLELNAAVTLNYKLQLG